VAAEWSGADYERRRRESSGRRAGWPWRCVVGRGTAQATYRRGKAVRAADFFQLGKLPRSAMAVGENPTVDSSGEAAAGIHGGGGRGAVDRT
jgi:hypothetical protein